MLNLVSDIPGAGQQRFLEIGLDFAPAQLHLFDARTERRLEAIDHAAGNG